MASSINVNLNYFDHPKTRRLVSTLGRDAALLPIRLWVYTAKHHPDDGRLPGYSPEEIESLIEWRGQRGRAVGEFVRLRFLDPLPDGDGFQVHDWTEHAGHLKRCRDWAKAAAQKRWAKRAPPSSGPPDADGMPAAMPAACDTHSQDIASHNKAGPGVADSEDAGGEGATAAGAGLTVSERRRRDRAAAVARLRAKHGGKAPAETAAAATEES